MKMRGHEAFVSQGLYGGCCSFFGAAIGSYGYKIDTGLDARIYLFLAVLCLLCSWFTKGSRLTKR